LVKINREANEQNNSKVIIFVSGFLSAEDNFQEAWKGFIDSSLDKDCDMYLFDWPAGNQIDFGIEILKNIVNLKNPDEFAELFNKKFEISEIYADLLAEEIMCNNLFKGKNISFVGFSLGCNIIKTVAKKIWKIDSSFDRLNSIIFLGGATTIDDSELLILKNIVQIVIINAFSTQDKILSLVFPAARLLGNGDILRDIYPIGIIPIFQRTLHPKSPMLLDINLTNINGGLGHMKYRANLKEIRQLINNSFVNNS